MELYVFGGWTAPRSSGTASFHIVKLPASCTSLWNPADSREPLLPGILGEMANNHECELNTNAINPTVDSGLPIPSAKSPLARQTQGRRTGVQVETQLNNKVVMSGALPSGRID